MTPLLQRLNARPSLYTCIKSCQPRRLAHGQALPSTIPSPTPFVPDAATFLSLIGRGLSQHASKIPDWQSLFTLNSNQMRELGIEPARSRRYLIWWRDRFRRGIHGIGGDLKNVTDGKAELRIVEIPAKMAPKLDAESTMHGPLPPRVRALVVNETEETVALKSNLESLKAVKGVHVVGAGMIAGPHTLHVKGSRGRVATIPRVEGMWEVHRGHKVDGGERRQKQIRRKRYLEESQTTRPS